MRATHFLGMRPSRAFQMQASRALHVRPSPALRMQPTRALRRKQPQEEQRAHTISQRLRTFRKIPVELLPLAAVIGVALIAAVYSMGNKLFSDKTLRLTRTGPPSKGKPDAGH